MPDWHDELRDIGTWGCLTVVLLSVAVVLLSLILGVLVWRLW